MRPRRQPGLFAAPAALLLAALAGAPGAALAQARPMDGTWAGTVNCPMRDLFDSGETPARGTIQNHQLILTFGAYRVQGSIFGIAPVNLLRLDGGGPRGTASFDGVIVTPERIHARGLVNDLPCNVNLTPVTRRAPAPQVQTPQPRAAPAAIPPGQEAIGDKPPPAAGSVPAPGPVGEKPPPSNAAPLPREAERPPPPREVERPAPPQAAAPRPAAPRPPSPATFDQMACALAGNCPRPSATTR